MVASMRSRAGSHRSASAAEQARRLAKNITAAIAAGLHLFVMRAEYSKRNSGATERLRSHYSPMGIHHRTQVQFGTIQSLFLPQPWRILSARFWMEFVSLKGQLLLDNGRLEGSFFHRTV